LTQYIKKLKIKGFNFFIHEAYNGLHAIESDENNDYDIIFMDIKMPGIDGIETSRRILSLRPNKMIIGCTGQVEDVITKKCLQVGMVNCIGKPLDIIIIRRLLDTFITTKRSPELYTLVSNAS
jgi:CheY-like chemotaxis protein